MADAKATSSYLVPPQLHGKLNSDGTYSLSALELKALNDYNYYVAKMIQGGLNLANLNSDTQKVFSDLEGNVTEVTETAAGLTVDVSNLKDKNTVTIDASGLYVTDENGGSTKLSGNHITTGVLNANLITAGSLSADRISGGSLQGVDVTSTSGYDSVSMVNGALQLTYGLAPVYEVGRLYSYNGSALVLSTVSGTVLRLESGSNMSINADGTVYIGTNPSYSGNVDIGQVGGTINLIGTVNVNGVPI